jgi:F-type H+-transporting ATPase subunit b
MQEIVRQLGELFLEAVPTVLIILLFYFILRGIFFKPLLRAMAEREARTVGAEKAAELAQARALEKAKQYQDAMKQARSQVYAEQEAARKKVLDERAALVKQARTAATAQVASAKERIAAEVAVARHEIETTVRELSAEIARRVLESPRRPGGSRREAR